MANARSVSPQLALEFLRDRSGTPLGAKDQVNEILRVCMRHNIRISSYITFRARASAAGVAQAHAAPRASGTRPVPRLRRSLLTAPRTQRFRAGLNYPAPPALVA